MTSAADNEHELRKKLNLETGKIEWSELQRHFARGVVIAVRADLELIDVALKFTHDDRAEIERWLNSGQLKRANDDLARQWQQHTPIFWAIVVAPWVLVQERSAEQKSKTEMQTDS